MIYRWEAGVVCGACEAEGCAHEAAVPARDLDWLPDLPDLAREPFWLPVRPGYMTRWVPLVGPFVLVATHTLAVN